MNTKYGNTQGAGVHKSVFTKQKLSVMISPALAIIIPFILGGIVMVLLGYDPIEAYTVMFSGALIGRNNLGTTLVKFTSTLLVGLAFSLSYKVKFFNLGMEGCLYMGAMATAVAGAYITGLPTILHLPLCILVGITAGGIWGIIPGYFKVYYNMNEACSTIMFNYIALYFTAYLVNRPLNSKQGMPQTAKMLETAWLKQILLPSNLSTGIFLALTLFAAVLFIVSRTSLGFKIQNVGLNARYADYMGFAAKKTTVWVVAASGAICGLCGAIDMMGTHRTFIESYAGTTMFDGLLSSMLVRNDMKKLPFAAIFVAILKSGALGMERNLGLSRALIDTIVNLLFLLVALDTIFDFTKHVKRGKKAKAIIVTKDGIAADERKGAANNE